MSARQRRDDRREDGWGGKQETRMAGDGGAARGSVDALRNKNCVLVWPGCVCVCNYPWLYTLCLPAVVVFTAYLSNHKHFDIQYQ